MTPSSKLQVYFSCAVVLRLDSIGILVSEMARGRGRQQAHLPVRPCSIALAVLPMCALDPAHHRILSRVLVGLSSAASVYVKQEFRRD